MRAFSMLAPVALAALMTAPAVSAQEGDPEAGQKVFNKCRACHRVGDNARNGVGPVLNDLFGRQAGTVEGYRYSNLNHDAGEAGLVWTEETVLEYLPDPSGFLKTYLTEQGKADEAKGRSKMVLKLPKEQDRRDVIAYLKQFSD